MKRSQQITSRDPSGPSIAKNPVRANFGETGEVMKTWKTFSRISAVLMLTGLVSACGSQAVREPGGIPQGSEGNPGGGTIPTPTPTSTTTPDGVAPVSVSFSVQGAGTYTSPAVNTDNLLKIRIIPNMAPVISSTVGYTPAYNCASFNVTVLGRTVRTEVLRVGSNTANCPNAKAEQIIDFSGRLSPGHNEVNILVDAVQTDWKFSACLNGGFQPYNLWLWPNTTATTCGWYSPMNSLYTTHTATGTLDIQVNGTGL